MSVAEVSARILLTSCVSSLCSSQMEHKDVPNHANEGLKLQVFLQFTRTMPSWGNV